MRKEHHMLGEKQLRSLSRRMSLCVCVFLCMSGWGGSHFEHSERMSRKQREAGLGGSKNTLIRKGELRQKRTRRRKQ